MTHAFNSPHPHPEEKILAKLREQYLQLISQFHLFSFPAISWLSRAHTHSLLFAREPLQGNWIATKNCMKPFQEDGTKSINSSSSIYLVFGTQDLLKVWELFCKRLLKTFLGMQRLSAGEQILNQFTRERGPGALRRLLLDKIKLFNWLICCF